MTTYPDKRRGLVYKIIGFLGEDETWEYYHGRVRKPVARDVILHLLKTGNGRRFDVTASKGVVVVVQKSQKIPREQAVPWVQKE